MFKILFLTPNPGLHVQYKNKLKLCTLFTTNCKYNLIKYFCMFCLVTHFDAKPPNIKIKISAS